MHDLLTLGRPICIVHLRDEIRARQRKTQMRESLTSSVTSALYSILHLHFRTMTPSLSCLTTVSLGPVWLNTKSHTVTSAKFLNLSYFYGSLTLGFEEAAGSNCVGIDRWRVAGGPIDVCTFISMDMCIRVYLYICVHMMDMYRIAANNQ